MSTDDSRPDPVLRAVAAAPALDPPLLGAPQIGDRYAIGEEIGRGGMGRVFRAHDRRLGRDVAIKVLAAGARGDAALVRMEQEARAAASIQHANIVVIHDIGSAGDAPYIVSELLEGATLRDRLAGDPLPTSRALDYARQLAQGLCAAHDHGVVHRDLKPENLFITDEGRLKILDFGIAKLVAPPGPPADASPPAGGRTERQTATGAMIGTAGYMSPEQARGEPSGPPSDLFSFGVILYEMLAGQRAFRGGDEVATRRAVLFAEPAPLPGRVPATLDRLVRRCLQKDPRRRFASARELLRELDVASAAPAVRGRRRIVAAAALLVLAATVGLAVSQRRGGSAAGAARITVAAADFVNETGEPELDGLSGMLITSLEQSRHMSVLTRGRMFDILRQLGHGEAVRIDERLGREIARQAHVDALVLASVRRLGALYVIDLKALHPAENEYLFTATEQRSGKESIPAMIDRLAERTRAGLHEKAEEIRAASVALAESTTVNLEAYQRYFEGEQLLARDEVDAALPELRRAIALDPRFALPHLALAIALGWQREQPDRAIEELETALRLGLPERERCLAEAKLVGARGRWEAAIGLIDGCAARYPDEKRLLYEAGELRFHGGDLAGGAAWLERALAVDPTFDPAAQLLLRAYQGLGRADKVLAQARAHAARAHDVNSRVELAAAELFAGDRASASATLREAARLFPDRVAPVRALAHLYLFSGEPDQAEATLRPVWEGRFQASDPRAALATRLAFNLYRARFRSAIAALDEAAGQARPGGGAVAAESIWSGVAAWKAFVLAAGPRDFAAARRIVATAPEIPPDFRFTIYYLMEDADAAAAVLATRSTFSVDLRLILDALRALERGDRAAAIAAYERAAMVPYLSFEARYRLAGLHLDAGEPRKALAELGRLQSTYLGADPLFCTWFPRSFYRAGLAWERLGDAPAALAAYEKFLGLWKDGDPDLAELREAQARVVALRRLARR